MTAPFDDCNMHKGRRSLSFIHLHTGCSECTEAAKTGFPQVAGASEILLFIETIIFAWQFTDIQKYREIPVFLEKFTLHATFAVASIRQSTH